jgi:anaerobic magnesium-protoporphyrin IX monomethyl ester cyclase
MKITLIHPPIDDPTLPYHSTAYLAGNLVHNGFTDVAMRDLNIEFVNYCLEQGIVEAFYRDGEKRLEELGRRSHLNLIEQKEYLDLWKWQPIDPGNLRLAVNQLRTRDTFLDYPSYVENVRLLNRYFGFLGVLSYPSAIINFKHLSQAHFSLYNLDDLFNLELSQKICYPLTRFFHDRMAGDAQLAESECLGISIVYDHQMACALWLARALKQLWPEKLLILGGTAISQSFKYMKDKSQMKRFFALCDAIVVGEGETAICQIADAKGDLTKKANFCNTITYDGARDQVRLPLAIHYENVPALAPPLYNHPWDLYLAPERGVNYSPTRGCYWNRCTFCDYGLNTDKPTSPWRERQIDQVIADLQQAVQKENVRYVYFAVDVMAPGYLERLSDGILEAGLDLRWSAELRMEKVFLPDRCKKMAQSGCVCVSFGMESGNQRVLDLIDKGTKVQYMGQTMTNFAQAGIAVQLMAFRDFPTETDAEKKETIKFVESNKEYWSTGGIGAFVLTGTAMVARKPEKFGIVLMDTKNVDIARNLAYRMEEETARKPLLMEEYDASFDDQAGIFPSVLGRPWAGGTDTLHSMIYYETYGRKFFKDLPPQIAAAGGGWPELLDCRVRIRARLTRSSFDISQILANRKSHKDHVKELVRTPIEPTYSELAHWQDTSPNVSRDDSKNNYWIATGERCMRLDEVAYQVLSTAETHSTMGEILSRFDEDLRLRLEVYFETLAETGLVELYHLNGTVKESALSL